jgi:hypothetical protein
MGGDASAPESAGDPSEPAGDPPEPDAGDPPEPASAPGSSLDSLQPDQTDAATATDAHQQTDRIATPFRFFILEPESIRRPCGGKGERKVCRHCTERQGKRVLSRLPHRVLPANGARRAGVRPIRGVLARVESARWRAVRAAECAAV